MKTLRRNWYNIGGIIAILSAIFLFFIWNDLSVLQRLLFLNFIAVLIHQYEEYGFPGGEPAIMNMAIQPSSTPDRYPLNQNSAMIINVGAAFILYLIPVFFPNVIWLGIAQVLFGLPQFIIHGIITPKKLGQFYNPGLGAVILLHFPIGTYYLYYIHVNHLVTTWDWIFAVTYLAAFTYVTVIKMTYSWLADKDSPYKFPDEEMKRFNVEEKLTKLKNRNSK